MNSLPNELSDPGDLPLHLSPLVRAWQCQKRGACCKRERIAITETSRRRIQAALEREGDPLASAMARHRLPMFGPWAHMPLDDQGCIFLRDNLCSLHARFGRATMPDICRSFPNIVLMTRDRFIASLSFQCPTAVELLAKSERFECVVETHGELPTELVSMLSSPGARYRDLDGVEVSEHLFWQKHGQMQSHLESRTERTALERLLAFAAAETGDELPEAATAISEAWKEPLWHLGRTWQLSRVIEEQVFGLEHWWEITRIEPAEIPLPEGFDEEAFLNRYLLHRVFAPTFYAYHKDLRFLLAILFGLWIRIRLERIRGADPLLAVRKCERLVLHCSTPEKFFGTDHETPQSSLAWGNSWRVMAAVALAAPSP